MSERSWPYQPNGPYQHPEGGEWAKIHSDGDWAIHRHRAFDLFILEHQHPDQLYDGWFTVSEKGKCYKCARYCPPEMLTAWKLLEMGRPR